MLPTVSIHGIHYTGGRVHTGECKVQNVVHNVQGSEYKVESARFKLCVCVCTYNPTGCDGLPFYNRVLQHGKTPVQYSLHFRIRTVNRSLIWSPPIVAIPTRCDPHIAWMVHLPVEGLRDAWERQSWWRQWQLGHSTASTIILTHALWLWVNWLPQIFKYHPLVPPLSPDSPQLPHCPQVSRGEVISHWEGCSIYQLGHTSQSNILAWLAYIFTTNTRTSLSVIWREDIRLGYTNEQLRVVGETSHDTTEITSFQIINRLTLSWP